MNTITSHTPDDELKAGYALADLSGEEMALWQTRAAEQGICPDEDLEWLALQLEIQAALSDTEQIPAGLTAALIQQIPQNLTTLPAKDQPSSTVDISSMIFGIFGSSFLPRMGWAIAACLTLLLIIQSNKSSDLPVADLSDTPATLEQQAKDLSRLKMSGTPGEYEGTRGEVWWSDELQKGYLLLSGIPVNDPKKSQYQLWIVDPNRDDIPVDGGVFDVVADASGKAQIEIQAKLKISDPKAFVITLEQPGGVVRSKQDTVVAIAKL